MEAPLAQVEASLEICNTLTQVLVAFDGGVRVRFTRKESENGKEVYTDKRILEKIRYLI